MSMALAGLEGCQENLFNGTSYKNKKAGSFFGRTCGNISKGD